MPSRNYKSVSLNEELVDATKQLIQKIGTYHSVSEFVSEAVRLRIETLEKTINNQETSHSTAFPSNFKNRRRATLKPKNLPQT
jgi:Arc/MetJ-type ribon-helix-helix transcriptional regulator